MGYPSAELPIVLFGRSFDVTGVVANGNYADSADPADKDLGMTRWQSGSLSDIEYSSPTPLTGPDKLS